MDGYKITSFPRSRLATIDVFSAGKDKHHVSALIEVDVTLAKEKLAADEHKISFTAWLIKVISGTIKQHEATAAYRLGKGKLIIFEDVNVSLMVEKKIGDNKVPIPLVIVRANEKRVDEITTEITQAKATPFTDNDIVLRQKSSRMERLYYLLPGFLRRLFWNYMLTHPRLAYEKMGNVGFTSVGMMGQVAGWFIPSSVHPICFGISSVVRKPHVINDQVIIRDILNMTILMDHDVIDGAPMTRFVAALSRNIENASDL